MDLLYRMLYVKNAKAVAEKIINGKDFIEKIYPCFGSRNFWLKMKAIDLLIGILDDKNIKVVAEKVVNSEDFAKKIDPCLRSKNPQLMYDAVYLLVMMLGNDNTKIAADKIVKDCLASENPQLKFCKSHLLLKIFDKKKTKAFAEKIVNGEDFVKFVKACLVSESNRNKLTENVIDLLIGMLGNDNTKVTAEKIVKDCMSSKNHALNDNTIELLIKMLKNKKTKVAAGGFIKTYRWKIEGWLKSGDSQLKASTNTLFTVMSKSKDENMIKVANELKNNFQKKS